MKPINWDELFRAYAPKLKGLCRRYVGSADIADDLVQQTFLSAIEKFSSYRGYGSIEGWIRKIAVNNALLFLRNQKPVSDLNDTMMNLKEQDEEMEPAANKVRAAIEQAAFSNDDLLSVIDALPEHHKIVFNLYVLDGFSHPQIAEMMSISVGTSKSHLSRARKKAQEMLYQKAIQHKDKSEQRHGLFLLLLFQPNYIDRVFRKGFRGFELAAGVPAASISSAQAVAVKWGATLAGKLIASASVITVVSGGTYVVCQQTNKTVNLQTNQAQTEMVISLDTVSTQEPDSVEIEKVEMEKPTPPANTAKLAPVIVKKKIVIRDTLRLEKPATK